MARKTDAELLAALEAKKAALEARMQAISARRKEADRKADTRRKVIIGGLLIERAGRDQKTSDFLKRLIAGIERDADKSAFDGWSVPAPEAAASQIAAGSPAAAETPAASASAHASSRGN